jgi:hypothetical protein
MSRYDSSGWPAVDDDVVVAGIRAAVADGQVDQLEGGVHPSNGVEYVDGIDCAKHLADRCMDLVEAGRLEIAHGVPPGETRPRTGFLPAGYRHDGGEGDA